VTEQNQTTEEKQKRETKPVKLFTVSGHEIGNAVAIAYTKEFEGSETADALLISENQEFFAKIKQVNDGNTFVGYLGVPVRSKGPLMFARIMDTNGRMGYVQCKLAAPQSADTDTDTKPYRVSVVVQGSPDLAKIKTTLEAAGFVVVGELEHNKVVPRINPRRPRQLAAEAATPELPLTTDDPAAAEPEPTPEPAPEPHPAPAPQPRRRR